jgi:5-aminolevulinate synthase
LIQQHTEYRKNFHSNVSLLRQALTENGIHFLPNHSHITSVPVKDATRCRQVANDLLLQQGVYLQPINYPTVPVGEECLRIITTAKHQPKHINHLAFSLNKILNGNNQAHRTGFETVAVTTLDSEA